MSAALRPSIDSKLPDVGTTIFTVMSQLAADLGAINLSQGFPSFDPDPRLLALVDAHLQAGDNQYAHMAGVAALREAIAAKVAGLYGRTLDRDDEITVTSGATEGLFSTIQAIVHAGDDVIVFDPAYDLYGPAIRLAGGRTRHLPLCSTVDRPEFHIDFDELADAMTDRTRLIVLNFPQNPTGSVLTRADLDALADVLHNSNACLLSDDVYEHLVFDDRPHVNLLMHDALWPRSVVVSSFGKTYNATGWKVGYCLAPPDLTRELRKVHQFTCFAVVTPIQHAIADFMQERPDYHRELAPFYQRKRDLFCDLLRDSRFQLRPSQGTFFQLLDYSAITDEDDVAYSRRLTREIGVASIPVSVFCKAPFGKRMLRFCFAKDDDTLKRAAERLCQL